MPDRYSGAARQQPTADLPKPPTGWPIGSYARYEEARRAVEYLADNGFPMQEVTVVGVDLMLVERIIGRLSHGRVLARGVITGAWVGLFLGLIMTVASAPAAGVGPMLVGLVLGAAFGVSSASMGLASARGRRSFSSASQLVAGRYDVLAPPEHAEQGRNMLARLAMRLAR